MRARTAARRLLAGALLSLLFASAVAPHSDPLSSQLLGDDSFAAPGAVRAITRHNPHSHASHWHAINGFIKEDPCLACQWNRLAGVRPEARVAPTVFLIGCAVYSNSTSVSSAPLGSPSSRGPPPALP